MSGLKKVVKEGWHPERDGKGLRDIKGVNRVVRQSLVTLLTRLVRELRLILLRRLAL